MILANAYIINDRETAIEMTMVVSKGYEGDRKTSVMRHAVGVVKAKSFKKIEVVQEDVLTLTNEFFVNFYADNKLHEKRFVFEKNTVTENNLINIKDLATGTYIVMIKAKDGAIHKSKIVKQ